MINNKLKKLIVVVLAITVMLAFAGCQSETSTSEDAANTEENVETKLDAIKAKGKIVLGTAADYPPYEFHKEIDGKDTIVGFDIDIAEAIAEDLGVELEIKDMKFDGLLAALVADNIDFIIAGMVPKPERKESVDFSIPYYQAEQKILIKAEDKDKFKSAEDFAGYIVGAQKATVQEEIALNKIEGAEVKSLSKITDLVLELKNDKIDAIVLVAPVAAAYAKQNPDLYVPDMSLGKEDGVAVAVNKGNAELLEEINNSLQKLLDSGKIDEFISEATLLADE